MSIESVVAKIILTSMRGQRTYADVPHHPAPKRWLEPVLLGSNAALYTANLLTSPTTKVVFREPFLQDAESDRPIIYITWHRLNYVSIPIFLALPREARPTLVAHDGVASRAFTHHSAIWIGFDVFVFWRRSSVPAREQIALYIRETRRPILNLPDSGGPYGVMKPGILEVARACNARIVPYQVTSTPTVTVGRTLAHVMPVPFSRLDVRRGPSLDGTATVDDCQRALDALG